MKTFGKNYVMEAVIKCKSTGGITSFKNNLEADNFIFATLPFDVDLSPSMVIRQHLPYDTNLSVVALVHLYNY